ncbi:TIGR04219 family outer membrane beta-barrel protein [Hydrogenimonas urashimensis]|uniref:TIGR04219 family outer membrane beta-barrel protein n=1 Tax=Hydrogenimonas urashimensis TaxID=2740515 RepID=UPI0019159769|nr:TIGR04219 family outer membrane beta-barrel protein [Hydrogenimonas urashimensis]
MKKQILFGAAAAFLSLGTVSASADTLLGGEIAVGGWHHDPGGWVKYPNDLPDDQSKVDADDDLNLDAQNDIYLRAKLEHPIPIVPNVKVAYTRTETEGDGRIERSFTFGNIDFTEGRDIHSEAKLDSYDGTLYYEVVDTGIDFDLGLTVRYFDGYVKVTDRQTGENDQTDIDFVVPMLYGNIRVPLPFLEGFSLGAEGNWITYDGSTLYDVQADARYTFSMGLGFEVGYRYEKVELDDVEDTDSDIDIQGVFFGALLDF